MNKSKIKMKKIQQFYDEPVAMTWHEVMEKYENHPKWKLPTRNELIAMYKSNKGSFESGFYWSSSEYGANLAWSVGFGDGLTYGYANKDGTDRVRVIRSF